MIRIALLLACIALGCASGPMVVALQHNPAPREEPLAAGISGLVFAVTLEDDRAEADENYLCHIGSDVLSERPVAQVVREAVLAELRVRDLHVAAPEQANLVLHVVLHEFGCRPGRYGIQGQIDAELGLRLMPSRKEVYWTTLTQRGFKPPTPGEQKLEPVVRGALEDVLDRFARNAATHPDLMIRIQELQARGELPQ